MTQLFDTETYDHSEHIDDARRHLRSIPAGQAIAERSTQWRLDDHTIETGRKGIQAARQALQDAARAAKDTDAAAQRPARKAA